MPYTDPQSVHNPTAGQVAPAAWGDVIRDNDEYFARNFPHCSIFESTPQSIANNTVVDLTSNEENSDIGGMHSTSSNTARITVPSGEGGLYFVSATVSFAANGTGRRVLLVRKNGSSNYDLFAGPPDASGNATVFSGSRSFVLAAADYMTCAVVQTSGGALDVTLVDFTVQWRAVA